ncbi:hypothetical protein K450DRAFT_217892 [Umbelopsis ramanniana AG]|uniref:PQ loop repeat protein n=1 Tax=Umbelopsis ramanniana AG TaxID=1314678 RepID=A0AAD5HJH6_UMBRA|nr:uncharacterized protein K450DRAFT_217892 [Umbelopsis ramanniana AG]KAI8584761.1 hypothetical protein K450DRAFT_217892 [Umbelopsis ramanniana AG]
MEELTKSTGWNAEVLTTFSVHDKICEPHHDVYALYISLFLCVGLVVSYLPQHYRIISNKTSEGFSAWFLLLGVVSATSSFLNIILLQWDAITCCSMLSTGSCLESLMGVFQIGLQWCMFCIIFILFLLYFPEELKHAPHKPSSLHLDLPRGVERSAEWKISLGIAVTCVVHLVASVIVTAVLLKVVGGPEHYATNLWASILGILSMILAAFQYLPQIWKTWRRKTVGALSIPMMLLQTPGSALFVYSIATRPGTNWTAWITYMVTGILQGTLLVMCIVWHYRSKRLGIDEIHSSQEDEPSERTALLNASE